jgi:hypothetical protein
MFCPSTGLKFSNETGVFMLAFLIADSTISINLQGEIIERSQ